METAVYQLENINFQLPMEKRTEAQLRKCWDNIKTRRKQILDKRAHKTERPYPASTSEARQAETAPLMPVKNELMRWEVDSDSDTTTNECAVAEVSLGTASPPRESASRLAVIETLQPKVIKKQNCRIEEREEELHKLKVAERVWLLKTLREQHATALVKREKVQLEREKAQIDRDIAQLQREKAQVELIRAKEEEKESICRNKH